MIIPPPPYIYKLHWLPVKYRILYKLLLITYNQKPTFLRDGREFVKDSVEKANVFNRFFHPVFSPPDPTSFTPSAKAKGNCLPSVQLTLAEVAEVLCNLDPNKACGPDSIPNRLLRNIADNIGPSLCRLVNLSLSLGIMPDNWKLANITAVFKNQHGFFKGRSTVTTTTRGFPKHIKLR